VYPGKQEPSGPTLSAYIFLLESQDAVDVRVGTSFISIEQARANLASEVLDIAVAQANELTQMGPGSSLESTARRFHTEWAELLDRKTVRKRT
jgi:putative alpha-1,2-mannosidase